MLDKPMAFVIKVPMDIVVNVKHRIYIYPVAGPELMKQKKYLHINEMHVDRASRESKRVINS